LISTTSLTFETSSTNTQVKIEQIGSNIREWKLSVIVGRKAMMKSTGDMPSTLQTRLDLNFANDYFRNKVQKRALEYARSTMDHTYRMIDQNYVEFMKHFSWQQKQHSDLLSDLGRDIERLRACQLHPALQT
jgi:hypothetical protein